MPVTQDEIIARIEARKPGDMLGFEWCEYLPYVDPARLKPFLKDDVNLLSLPPAQPVDRDALLAKMLGYMPFAFGKAHDGRGVSANRSVQHYIAWTWLAGDVVFADEIDRTYDTCYSEYGLPILRRICEFYGWNPNALGDG